MGLGKAEIEGLYRRRYVGFRHGAVVATGDLDLAHDAVQEGFAQALAQRKRYRGGSLEAWVWRIVLSRAHDLRRQTGRTPQISVRDEFIPVDHDPELAAAVRALPERRRMVVFLRYFAEFSYGEIADTCGMSEGTVGATLSQAHAELRAALTPEGVQP